MKKRTPREKAIFNQMKLIKHPNHNKTRSRTARLEEHVSRCIFALCKTQEIKVELKEKETPLIV